MITNSDQVKHTRHSKGCPNTHINTQCTPSGGNAGMYSCMQTVKGVECLPAIDCLKHLAPVVAIQPFEQGRIIGLREAGMDISTDCCTCWTQCIGDVAVFSSGMWNIPTLVDQVLDNRIVQTQAKIDTVRSAATTSREEIRTRVALAVPPRTIGNHLLAAELRSHVPLARLLLTP